MFFVYANNFINFKTLQVLNLLFLNYLKFCNFLYRCKRFLKFNLKSNTTLLIFTKISCSTYAYSFNLRANISFL